LCDEPTGALDVHTGIVVLEAIARINQSLGTERAKVANEQRGHAALMRDDSSKRPDPFEFSLTKGGNPPSDNNGSDGNDV